MLGWFSLDPRNLHDLCYQGFFMSCEMHVPNVQTKSFSCSFNIEYIVQVSCNVESKNEKIVIQRYKERLQI